MPSESSTPYILLANDIDYVTYLWNECTLEIAPNARILTAASAYEVEQQIRQYKPDIMILDVTLPESEFNPYLREREDVATHSSRVGEFYRKECPHGQLIVCSTYAAKMAHRFPPGTKFINPSADSNRTELKAAISSALGGSSFISAPDVFSFPQEGTEPLSIRHRSRIQAIRDGLFYEDPELREFRKGLSHKDPERGR